MSAVSRFFHALSVSCVAGLLAASTLIAGPSGLTPGPVELQSVGPMAFASSGVLLVADPKAATIYALATEDSGSAQDAAPQIDNLPAAIQSSLNLDGKVELGELAVNPDSGNSYLTIKVGDQVQLVRISGAGEISQVNLDKVMHAKKVLPNPPEDKEVSRRGRTRNARNESITDLAFFDGKVLVSGLAAGDAPSRVIEMPFPFAENSVMTSVEIFHAAHGRVEDATIQTFLPMNVDGQPSLLAGFTCTPLVRFPVNALDGSEKVRGTTVAELGNRNTPLDMLVYEKDGKTSILMSNNNRGVMKISTDDIGERESLTEKVDNGGTAGQAFETVVALEGVQQMDKLNDSHAVAIIDQNGTFSLRTIELP
ncbi:hypothetical protein NHH03_10175 [Stieleria sp. TO1_6]|uniref:hypothetical protein n=1 Tax=Stieleria tagensis TaxID=2956795 RepID=UPI00209B76B0|nr:hypothetical protein [Stieleria tagensis]MCO8122105.1 hypothetical protein [Stieleria tagensis]